MISQTTEYALRAVVHLASSQRQGQASQTTQQIAQSTKVPASYLSKVLQSLSRAGLVDSQRGVGGGFQLARPMETMTIYDVVQAMNELSRIRECPLGLPEHVNLCPLHARLDEAIELVAKAFRASTIAELVDTAPPLCKIAGLACGAPREP